MKNVEFHITVLLFVNNHDNTQISSKKGNKQLYCHICPAVGVGKTRHSWSLMSFSAPRRAVYHTSIALVGVVRTLNLRSLAHSLILIMQRRRARSKLFIL